MFQGLLQKHFRDMQHQCTTLELRLTKFLENTSKNEFGGPHELTHGSALSTDDFTPVLDAKPSMLEQEAKSPTSPKRKTTRKSRSRIAQAEEEDGDSATQVKAADSVSPKSTPASKGRKGAGATKLLRSQSGTMSAWKIWVNSWLDIVMGMIVVLNLMVMIAELELLGKDADYSLGKTTANDNANIAFFEYCEYIFFALYLGDVIIRIAVMRLEWLIEEHTGAIVWVNLFDLFVVLVNAVELCVLPFTPLRDSDFQDNVGNAKVMKLIRITRVLRVVRTSRIFGQLRMLLATTIASMGAFFWSILLLFIFQVSFSLIISQLIHSAIVDRANNLQTREWLNVRYGSFFKSLYTMFEITYSGGWPSLVRRVIEDISPWYAILFLLYITFVVFAVIRVITALFIKETLACAANDAEIAMEEKRKTAEVFQTKLEMLFESMDVDADGLLSQDEVHEALSNPLVVRYLSTLELHMKDVEFIYKLLDDGDGMLTIKEFCHGLSRLKGVAQSHDVVLLLHEQHTLKAFCHEIYAKLEELCGWMGMPKDHDSDIPPAWTSHSRRNLARHSPSEA